jgi:hypothetical protein
MQPVSRECLGKHIPAATNTHATIEEPVSKQQIGKHTAMGVLLETVFLFGPCKVVIKKRPVESSQLSSGVPSERLV